MLAAGKGAVPAHVPWKRLFSEWASLDALKISGSNPAQGYNLGMAILSESVCEYIETPWEAYCLGYSHKGGPLKAVALLLPSETGTPGMSRESKIFNVHLRVVDHLLTEPCCTINGGCS